MRSMATRYEKWFLHFLIEVRPPLLQVSILQFVTGQSRSAFIHPCVSAHRDRYYHVIGLLVAEDGREDASAASIPGSDAWM